MIYSSSFEKNHFGGQIVYRSPDPVKKRRRSIFFKWRLCLGDGEPKQADCEKPFNSTHQQEIDKLSKINRTISSASEKSFEKWSTFDLEQTQFCDVDDEEDPTMVFVDLLQNPERFTGYDGEGTG